MTIPTVHHAFVWEAEPRRYTATVSCELALSLVHGGTASFRNLPTFYDAIEIQRVQNLRAPYKPRADVIVLGNAYVPAQDPETDKVLVRFRLGDYAKAVRVVGDRNWIRVDGRWTHDTPRKFRRMLLSPERSPRGPENPSGFDAQAFPAEHRLGLPNLEPVGSGFGAYLGPVSSAASIRTQSLHPSGAAWAMGFLQATHRSPPPQGFDFGFFNIAPPDQQLRELPLGAAIVLEHLSPEHLLLTSRLPFITVDAEIRDARGQDHAFALSCDTLWLDTEQSLVLLTFRGACAITAPGELLHVAVLPGIREAAPTGGRSPDLQRTGIGALPQASTMPFIRPPNATAPSAPPKLQNGTPFTNPSAPVDEPSTSDSYPPPPKPKMNITQEIELEAPKLHAGLPFEADDEPSTGVRTSTPAPPDPKPTQTIPPPQSMMDESSTPFEETIDRTPRTYRIAPPAPPPSGTLRAHQVTHRRLDHVNGMSDSPTETTATDPGMVPAVIPFASPSIAKPRGRKLEAPELPPTKWPPLPPAPRPAMMRQETRRTDVASSTPSAPPAMVHDIADPVSQLGTMRLGGTSLRSTSDPPDPLEPSSRQLADEPTQEKPQPTSSEGIPKAPRKTILMRASDSVPPKLATQPMPPKLATQPMPPKLATQPMPPKLPPDPAPPEIVKPPVARPATTPMITPRITGMKSNMAQEESTVTGVAMLKHFPIESRTLDDVEAEADRDAFEFPLPPSDGFEVEGVTLEHCAAIRAHLAISGVDRDAVLSLHSLDAAIWARIEREHLARLDGETSRGEFELLRRYDAAYVAAQDKVRQPIGVGEWAQIVRAKRDGNLGPVLSELGVARTELMRLERVWKLRAENHPDVQKLLEKLLEE